MSCARSQVLCVVLVRLPLYNRTALGTTEEAESTYAGEISIIPDDLKSECEKVLKVYHGYDGVDEESCKVRKGSVRDAVGCTVDQTS